MSTILRTSRRLLLAELEATYGVDPIPSPTTNAILVKTMTVTPMEATQLKRDLITPYFGNKGTILAETYVKLEIEVELAGSGTAGTAPAFDPLIQACGFASTVVATTSVTYSPISTGIKSATLYYYNDGALHKLTGCYGDMEISLAAKVIPTIKFTFMGIYADPSAVALPTNTVYGAAAEPVVPADGVTSFSNVGGYNGAAGSVIVEKLDLKLANKVDFRSMAGAQYVIITDRMPTGSVVVQAMTPDVYDYFGVANRAKNGAISMSNGTVPGNQFSLNMNNCAILNPSYTDNAGVQMLTIPFDPQPTLGNDEMSLAFT